MNELAGNDFSGAELIDVGFMYGVDLSQQKLPKSDAYIRLDRLANRMREARSVVRREWRGTEQEQALIMLDVLDGNGSDPWQQDLFFRRDEELAPPPVRDRVSELLKHALD